MYLPYSTVRIGMDDGHRLLFVDGADVESGELRAWNVLRRELCVHHR